VIDARSHLQTLVGTEMRTLTEERKNRIIRIEGDEVIVGTSKSPDGRAVPIQWLQDAIDVLLRDGEVAVDVETLGHRGAFVGAFLATLLGTCEVDNAAPSCHEADVNDRHADVRRPAGRSLERGRHL
jgi:hypothetical protein